jgi:hypothetical protein
MTFGLPKLTTLKLYSEALSVSVFHSAEHGSGSFERDRLAWVKGKGQKKHFHSQQIPLYHILSTELKTVHPRESRCTRLFITLNSR